MVDTRQAIFEVKNITQRFAGVTALEDVSLNVHKGQIVGIIGPNGAGKTTLFNVITGVYDPTEGKVFLNGKDITGMKPYEITKLGFARTFQNIRLFNKLTVIENVEVGMVCRSKTTLAGNLFSTKRKREEKKVQREKAIELLELMKLENKQYHLPGSLPYGEQRRLEIARALATKPSILLLDEPAAGMNEQETEELRKTVLQIQEMGYTIILIEHDMKFVMQMCEWIYVLNHGKLIASGRPEAIKANEDVIEAYLGRDVD